MKPLLCESFLRGFIRVVQASMRLNPAHPLYRDATDRSSRRDRSDNVGPCKSHRNGGLETNAHTFDMSEHIIHHSHREVNENSFAE